MPESEDGVFLDLKLNEKVISEEVPVGVILQALAEYGMLPMATPAIHRVLCSFNTKILNPSWLKEQEAKAHEQMQIAENMQSGVHSMLAQQFGIELPPSASDLEPPK